MRIENIGKYLSDEKFNDGLEIRLNFDNERKTRIEKIIELSSNKRVIHVGCVDHIPLIEEKIANNTWLHKLLTDKASECIGVDINREGIEFINKLGFTNTFHADLMQPSLEKLKETWDYMVLGEILEHVDNPCNFLETLNKLYRNNVDKIIISVPNAFCLYNFENVKKGFERINSDHRSTFTAYTLNKILHIANFKLDELFYVDPIYKFHHKVINKLSGKKTTSVPPGLSNTLLAIASFK
jgi:2-polyprenyl-3-methyl-5-hydroxy-6-metoxy-1,4-benzoquinol methylase